MVAALLAAAVISACSASPAINTGPLGSAGDGFFSQCSPASPGQTVTMGIWWLHNDGTSPVTVQSVHLGGRNLRITRPWLLPIYHNLSNGQFDAVGVSLSYPPTTGRGIPASAALSIWDERQPADGG